MATAVDDKATEVARLDPARFVVVGERGAHTALTRLYGRASHDQWAAGPTPCNHGKNTTFGCAHV